MNNSSRTANVARNATVSLICQIITTILSFAGRTVFISVLGKEYLGVNGLFTNVLTMLSFAELGIGNAIIFNLYKPIAEGNMEKIKSLMKLYKQAYRIIALVVATVGIAIVPFLKYIITSKPDIPENLVFIYLLFLINTVISYLYIYKSSIIIANQKNYIVITIQQIFDTVRFLAQILVLFITKSFVLYLIMQIVFTAVANIMVAQKANKLYPYLKEEAQPLQKEEKIKIFKNVKDLAIYKFASVILNGTDNIIISALFSVADVGLYSNYIIISNILNTLCSKIIDAFTASVGNLNAGDNTDAKYNVFGKLFFVCAWIYGFVALGFALMINKVILLWIGEEYIMHISVVIAVAVNLYVCSMNFAAYTYRTTLGFFAQGKIAPAIAAVLNVVLSIWLGKMWGLCGVLFATSISRFFTMGIVDPVLVYTKTFKKNVLTYYLKYLMFVVLYIGFYFVLKFILGVINIEGLVGAVVDIAVISIVYNLAMVLIFYRTKAFTELLEAGKSLISRRVKKCI